MSDTDPYAAPEEILVAAVVESVVEAPVEAPEAVEEVPEGPVKTILAWVGEDQSRAQQALTVENSGLKRTSLITKLEAIIEG